MLNLHGISQRFIDGIVGDEVTNEAYFTRHYRGPTWPGFARYEKCKKTHEITLLVVA